MGCARVIWNAKCDENRYFTHYAKCFCPIGTYAPIDQRYSQFKDREKSSWLFDCPSQILRNSASNWYKTYQHFMQGLCGKPRRKKKSKSGSIHLTKELFEFRQCEDGVTRLFIGSKRNHIGFLSLKNHANYQLPQSIYIKKHHGNYTVSFCYEDSETPRFSDNQAHLEWLKSAPEHYLDDHTVGIDRGIAIPVQVGDQGHRFTPRQKAIQAKRERKIKHQQKRWAKQQKNSNRSQKTKHIMAMTHRQIKNARLDFSHKTSHAIVHHEQHKVFIFEDLQIKNRSKKPKAKPRENGKGWECNKAKAKAGLNKAILDKGWGLLETFVRYKALRLGKAVFNVPAFYSSQECAQCGHTHPDNRKTQSVFQCGQCGHTDNADRNACMVLKKRAIQLIQHSGTELSKRGVLVLDTGRGVSNKTSSAKAGKARNNETSKKKVMRQHH